MKGQEKMDRDCNMGNSDLRKCSQHGWLSMGADVQR